jgi:hypothetical protein
MTLFPDDPRAIRGIKRNVPKIAIPLARMVEHWGVKCDTFEPECACCKAWALFDGVNFVKDVQ